MIVVCGRTELAAAAFLARYHGRTLDAYRYDLRAFFQWAVNEALKTLERKELLTPGAAFAIRGDLEAG